MSDYKAVHGTKVQNIAGDPPAPFTGQVWYNTTAGTLKYQAVLAAGSWATTNALNSGREASAGGGTSTAALVFGGNPNGAYTDVTGLGSATFFFDG